MKLVILFGFLVAAHAQAMTLTKDFVTTRLKFNDAKKVYDVDFLNEAGIYKAEDKFFSCLQSSLKSKKPVKVTYDPIGLKLTDCVSK